MSYIKYLVALFALFMVMMPAFSMPDDGQMMGSDGQHQGIKSMMGDGGVKIVCLTVCKVIGPDSQNHMSHIKSMMGGKSQCSKAKSCGCEKSMMGQDGQNQKSCGCEKSMHSAIPSVGQDGQNQKHHSQHHHSDDSDSSYNHSDDSNSE